MSDGLVAVWHSNPAQCGVAIVLPDGCRDLIVRTDGNGEQDCYVSPLFDTAETFPLETGVSLTGFRLKPGAMIDEHALIEFARTCSHDLQRLEQSLDEFVNVRPSVHEALACLAGEAGSVMLAAKQLGVSERTLQRTVMAGTGRSPGYWLQLARVRKAARALARPGSLAELAWLHGFSDQSHMNREFRRWFDATPMELSGSDEMLAQLDSPAYG